MRDRIAWMGAVALAAAVGCGGAGSDDRPPAPEPLGDDLERLVTLGYVDAAPTPADESESIVTVHRPGEVSPGVTLVTSHRPCVAILVDVEGRTKREWKRDGDCPNWVNGRLVPGGDLLVTEGKGGLSRLSWDGKLRYTRALGQHHDASVGPDRQLVLLLHERRTLDEPLGPGDRGVIVDDVVALASQWAEVSERISLYDAAVRSGVQLDPAPAPDLLHANSVAWMRRRRLAAKSPLYALHNVLVSVRNQNALWILDSRTGRILWSWGPGELDGQHDATLLANGHILVFDNGMQRGWSRVVEIDPLDDRIVWEYGSADSQRFHSRGRGGAQRLPNGNTLISDSDNGRAFEVNPEGDLVWEFRNPFLVEHEGRQHRAPLWARRYVEAVLPKSS